MSILFSPVHEFWDLFFICFTLSNPNDEYRMINYFKVLSMSEYKYFRNINARSFKTLLAAEWYNTTFTLQIKTRKAVRLQLKTSTNFRYVKAGFFKAKVPLSFYDLTHLRTAADTWGSTRVSTRTHRTSMLSPMRVLAALFSVSLYSISAFLVMKMKTQLQLASRDSWQSNT